MKIEKEQLKELTVHGFAVVGFVAVLTLGLWGTFQVARLAPQALSSLAAVATSLSSVFTPAESLSIIAPQSTIPTDTVYKLTWSHRAKPATGSYTFAYTCRDGLSLQSPNAGGIYEKISCDTPFAFSSEESSLLFIPLLEKGDFIDVPVTLTAIDANGNTTKTATATLTIAKSSVTQSGAGTPQAVVAGEQTTGTYAVNESRATSNPNGLPDLAVRIIGVGVITANNEFVPTSSIKATEARGAVQFEISNKGTKTSDNWTFNAVLPTFPMHIFSSESQQALHPGDKIVFTLGFNQLNQSATEGIITINADPAGSMKESDESNNIKQIKVTFTK